MYAPFFGLSQEPFSIAPDPRFLFMSGMHREALAHLLYGVAGGGGFVLLTGEIGAGKTTVCRAFLEQVPAHCTVAYVFNPKLTVAELLQTVCDEFHIALPETATAAGALKGPVDALNRFLLDLHAQGRQAVLIIDEAQGLSAEVLEQLRLLTNLETAERKLLQIVLIGQPELRDLLARPELEQLAQRVIARWHLPALSAAETAAYVQHRLAVAGPAAAMPFDAAALARIHALTGGVPRRINLLCDRALLGAYAQGRRGVNRATVEQAAREVFGGAAQAGPTRAGRAAVAVLLALGVLALGWLLGRESRAPGQANSAAAGGSAASGAAARVPLAGVATAPAAASPGAASAAAASAAGATPAAVVATATPEAVLAAAWHDEAAAWRALAPAWRLNLADSSASPCVQAAAAGLACFRSAEGLTRLRQLDRPAWLRLFDERGRPAFVQLHGLTGDAAVLGAGGTRWRLPLPMLARHWRGEFATFWRPPTGWAAGAARVGQPPVDAAWLADRLAAAGYAAAGASAASAGRDAVRAFQVAQGLPADGVAGPLTLMLLARPAAGEPRLSQER